MADIEPLTEDLTALSAQGLDDLITSGNEALDALFAMENPTSADVADAQRITSDVARLSAEKEARASAAATMAELSEARRVAASTVTEDETAVETPAETPVEAAVADEEETASEETSEETNPNPEEEQAVTASTVQRLADERPPAPTRSVVTITAAADVPHFATGSVLDGLDGVAQALVNRSKGFPRQFGIEGAQMQRYGVASLGLSFPDHLIADNKDDMAVVASAAKETSLDGGSLVAAGGWCAPSETLYDFCQDESTDGLLDLPEIAVTRGGVRYTSGPDFSAIYNAGFTQTEAQAIAGTTKTCYEVDCPDFDEVRLDAIGICIKVPLLTNAAYPELVKSTIAKALIAHQHRASAYLVNKMVTASGTALATGSVGSVGSNALNAVELVAETTRQQYRLADSHTIEVKAPHWLKSVIRADLASRNGVDLLAVTDADIARYFGARNVSVQFIFNWQSLANNAVGYPATAQLLVYPAGTFVKGTADVISLDAVYDAASLSVNTMTGLFFEQGLLLLQNCYASKLVEIVVCAGGVTGEASNAACFTV